ncbi:hypothetical protein OHW20_02510 [Acinetobacter baumannii]|nr:hypothetical protein [Acinetobacter baumannii]
MSDVDAIPVIPEDPEENTSKKQMQDESAISVSHYFGKITKTIGTGENAKNSIIWMSITWSFYTASALSLCVFILILVAYLKGDFPAVENFMKHLFSMWTIFTPIITLALGYAFGKDQTK